MEAASSVSEPVLASAELAEVGGSLRDDVVVELEDDTAARVGVDRNVKLQVGTTSVTTPNTFAEEKSTHEDLSAIF